MKSTEKGKFLTSETSPDHQSEGLGVKDSAIFQSSFRAVVIIALSVFLSETVVMTLISLLPPFSARVEALLDSTLLVTLLSPVLYFYLFRPLVHHVRERQNAEEALRKTHDKLEHRVAERTAKLRKSNEQLNREIQERKRAEKKLLTYQEELRSLVSDLSLTEERERRRLAEDLHDSVSQVLAIAKLKVEALRNGASGSALARDLAEIWELLRLAIQQMRSLIFQLSSPVLYQFGLEAAVESLVEQIEEMHRVHIDLTDDQQPKPLTEEVQVCLFRAVQELLVNIVKHAQVQKASVSIGREGDYIRIAVVDDGVGFDTSDMDFRNGRRRGFGLFSLKERLKHLDGYLEIASKPCQGTRATLVVPLQPENYTAKEKMA